MISRTIAGPSDHALGLAFVILAMLTLFVASESHAFCSLFCLHGEPMVNTEICATRG
jgi:hypothetical protein